MTLLRRIVFVLWLFAHGYRVTRMTNWDYILRDIIVIVLCVVVLVALAVTR